MMESPRKKALWVTALLCAAGGLTVVLLLSDWFFGNSVPPAVQKAAQPTRVPPPPPPSSPAPGSSGAASARTALTAEQKEVENARLRVLVSEALRLLASGKATSSDVASPPPPRNANVAQLWQTELDRIWQARADLDAKQALAQKMAELGRAGIDFLVNTARNRSLDVFERDTAVRVLSLIRSRDALAAVIKLREPDVMELDYPYDLVMLQAASLPTSDVRAFIPEILRQVNQELGSDTLAPERPELLAILALAHGDRQAQALLYDERILHDNLAGAVMVANDIHSPQARQFLDWVGERGAGGPVGDLSSVLEAW